MSRGVLQHGGLDSTGRKMDQVSSTFTSADFVLIQEYDTLHPLLPTRSQEHCAQSFLFKAKQRSVTFLRAPCLFWFHWDRRYFEMTASISRGKCILFHLNTHILTLFKSGLITLSQTFPCKAKVALEQISLWKGVTSSSKPLSVSIKRLCYAFNNRPLRTTVSLWLFSSQAKLSHSLLYSIQTMRPNRVVMYRGTDANKYKYCVFSL